MVQIGELDERLFDKDQQLQSLREELKRQLANLEEEKQQRVAEQAKATDSEATATATAQGKIFLEMSLFGSNQVQR